MWESAEIRCAARPRGIHLVTDEVLRALPGLARIRVGLLHLHLQHTSAALALNENAAPGVRADLARWFDGLAPDGTSWEHDEEGPDDMPAHAKAVIVGASLTLPIRAGRLALGTWQGIYLCEFRDRGGPRTILATLNGE
jgi:secondary thiamine-phosphate synthase enzyme